MSFDAEKLYELLPEIYRLRDAELAPGNDASAKDGGPLKALLSVIAEQSVVLADNLEQLYDDFFIETCAEWVVPYIGDLVGARGISAFPGSKFTQRAIVANTMRYRRRKGTAAMLEQLARDVTNWEASVVEYFQLLATTQYMNHIRAENLSFADIGDSKSLELINTPFDKLARTLDVRRIAPRRGKYNIPNIGIFLWRLGSYSVKNAPAFKVDSDRYRFDALGKDIQLYNFPQSEDDITHLAQPINVPMPLRRRVVDRFLDYYYGRDKSLLVTVAGEDLLTPEASAPDSTLSVSICDLSDLPNGNGAWAHRPANRVAIDPVLGRISFPEGSSPQNVRVTYHYGFSAAMAGGEYDREDSFSKGNVDVKVPAQEATIQLAVDQLAAGGGIIEVTNTDLFFETPAIHLDAANKKLELRATDGRRPVIAPAGDITVVGSDLSEVTLNGFIIAGRIRIPKNANGNTNNLQRLVLRHCTLVPGAIPALETFADGPIPALPAGERLIVESPNTIVEIDRCIVGPIQAVSSANVEIRNSIVDATSLSGVAFSGLTAGEPGASLTIENSTIIGKVYARTMKLVSNTIFFAALRANDTWAAPIRAARLQQGCVRFSFVPSGSRVPRMFRCQPAIPADVKRVRPVFTSLRYGDAGYCQLSNACAVEITNGADDQSEMGAFHNLYQPRREANLRAALDEYLRFGLEAGIFYAS